MGSDQARAVTVHQEQAGLFESRYEQFERDPYFDSFTYSRRKLEQVLAHYLDPLPNGAKLLDVGCGTGNLLRRLGSRFVCAGCDPAEEMLQRARARNPGVELKVAPAEKLPFEDDHFDVVLCIEVMRYLADPRTALRELARVLRPGGRAVLAVRNSAAPTVAWSAHVTHPLARRAKRVLPFGRRLPSSTRRPPSLERLSEQLERVGLRMERVENVGATVLPDPFDRLPFAYHVARAAEASPRVRSAFGTQRLVAARRTNHDPQEAP